LGIALKFPSTIQRSQESRTEKFAKFKKESLAVAKQTHDKCKSIDDPLVKNINKVKSKMYTIEENQIVADNSFKTLLDTWANESESNKEAWKDYQTSLKAYRDEQEKIKKEEEAKKPERVAYTQACDEVFAEMEQKFANWNGTLKTRGAWWGAATPGFPVGAKKVADSVVRELKKRVGGTAWVFSDSWSGGLSFHRKRQNNIVDFIYHMQPPES
jgi:hypothetical protein